MKNHFIKFLVLSVLLILGTDIETINAQTSSNVSKWPRGVTYEIFVQSFADSDGDGIGDIKGMTSKLDYLEDLGVEGIWLMPMNPSPSYHKYDVSDYYDIHPDYGTLADFKTFVNEAHKRNIKVVMDMVLNHSGSRHPWFQDAIANENSPYRDYYVWAHKDDPQTQVSGKIISGDSNNRTRWNKVEGSDYLYYSYFSRNMPDLNYDNPKLREEVFKIGKFWLSEIKVDGFRLDAARHIFPDDRPTDNHNWWVQFQDEMKKANKDVYLIGEVWASSDIVAPYLKGLPALFNFDMGSAITTAVNEEREGDLTTNHKKIIDYYTTVNPEYIDATFLTNHDQVRIMSAVNNSMEKAKMAAALLLTLPGSPYVYYGEEIGMQGKKPDPNIREPFLWQAKGSDNYRASWIDPKYSTDQTVIPVEEQLEDENSIYNHYKTFIKLRNGSKALTYGDIEPISLDKSALSVFKRSTGDESVLVIHNLSSQEVNIKLPESLKAFRHELFKSKDSELRINELHLPAYSTIVLGK